MAIGLCLVVICLYGQSLQFEFINFDDEFYVVRNEHVNTGLSWSGVYWAFSDIGMSNWHPVTWFSRLNSVQCRSASKTGSFSRLLIR